MLGQHLCERLCFTKPVALDWSNTHKHFMQLCCLALTPSVINCHWDKFSVLWHEFFWLTKWSPVRVRACFQWEGERIFPPPFNQEAYLVWDITSKLFMYFHSTSSLGHSLAFSLWINCPNLWNKMFFFFISSLRYKMSTSLPHKSYYLFSFLLQKKY